MRHAKEGVEGRVMRRTATGAPLNVPVDRSSLGHQQGWHRLVLACVWGVDREWVRAVLHWPRAVLAACCI